MEGFECWFCGQTIDPTDAGAVLIGIGNLWTPHDDGPGQAIAAHSSCARDRLKSARGWDIDPSVFRSDD